MICWNDGSYSRSVIWNLAKLLVNILQKVQRPPSNGDNGWTFVFSFIFGIHVLGKLMEWEYGCTVALSIWDTILKAFVSWHFICVFFHVRVGTTSLCWSLFSGRPHLRRILFARLDVPWTTGSRVKGFVKTGTRFRRLRGEFIFFCEKHWKTSQSTEIAKHHAFFLIIFLQLRFVTLGFYHDQMFRAVFKALEAGPALAEGTTSGVKLYLQCRGRMLLQCLVILCLSLGVMVLLKLGCWFSIWKWLLLDC